MTEQTALEGRDVYIVDGSRTPFLKARSGVGPFSASDLAVNTAKILLNRQPFSPEDLSEVITGCVIPAPDEMNIARIIALRLGCGKQIPAFTVQRNCASGMQALDSAAQDIAQGRADLVLAGGTEAMSRAPLQFGHAMANWLGSWITARSFSSRMKVLAKLRPSFFAPIITLLTGLTDPLVGLSMGQTAEVLAYRFNIDRDAMDQFAFQSHQRVLQAREQGYLNEITALYDNKGKTYADDDGVRAESELGKLTKLKPFFDKKFGMVTPGNSSQVTDGAAMLLLASKDAVKQFNLPVKARIVDAQWAAVDPKQMGLGPIHAATPIMQRHSFEISDIDYWEINEAFAAQVIACSKAWQDDKYCKDNLNLPKAMGKIPEDRLNIDGGAVALGHPIGASGARIVLHLLNILERENAHRGLASICIGGGQGGAMLIERTTGVQ